MEREIASFRPLLKGNLTSATVCFPRISFFASCLSHQPHVEGVENTRSATPCFTHLYYTYLDGSTAGGLRQGAGYVTVLVRDATQARASRACAQYGEMADMGWRLMKTGACDWATNNKNDGRMRRTNVIPAVPRRPPAMVVDGRGRRRAHITVYTTM